MEGDGKHDADAEQQQREAEQSAGAGGRGGDSAQGNGGGAIDVTDAGERLPAGAREVQERGEDRRAPAEVARHGRGQFDGPSSKIFISFLIKQILLKMKSIYTLVFLLK